VRLLLDHGAQACGAGSLGPLGTDRTTGELLVAHGFDLDVPVRGQALLELGADPNAPNAKGRTPLSIATGAGSPTPSRC
jgi:ankyrin repeat protein